MAHTGPYGHKNGTSIEAVADEQMGRMKTFKNAKPISSQWLTKKNAVRQVDEKWLQYDTPREKP